MDDIISADMIRSISRHSLAYMLCFFSEVLNCYNFDPLDLILIYAVMNCNVEIIWKNPELDRRFSRNDTVEPDDLKKGISRVAIAKLLNLPLETVRRRVDGLKKSGVLSERGKGLVVLEDNHLKFGNNPQLQSANALLLRKMFRDMIRSGVVFPGRV